MSDEVNKEENSEIIDDEESIIEEEIKDEISTELQDEISEEVEKKLIELEEEEYKPRIIKDEFEEEYVSEQTYTIPLRRKILNTSRLRRAKKAITTIREFITRHMKPVEIIIHPEVNEKIWERGIKKPPSKIHIRASKDKEGLVYIFLA